MAGLPCPLPERQRGRSVVQQVLRLAVGYRSRLRLLGLNVVEQRRRQRGSGVDAWSSHCGYPGSAGQLDLGRPPRSTWSSRCCWAGARAQGVHELPGGRPAGRLGGQAGLRASGVQPGQHLGLAEFSALSTRPWLICSVRKKPRTAIIVAEITSVVPTTRSCSDRCQRYLTLATTRCCSAAASGADRQPVRKPADDPAHPLLPAQRHLPGLAHVPLLSLLSLRIRGGARAETERARMRTAGAARARREPARAVRRPRRG